jgi:tetratricopeptide (TPR) repeat protein
MGLRVKLRTMDFRRHMSKQRLVCLALVVVSGTVFCQLRHCGFINFDDPEYVTDNFHVRQGLTVQGVVWAFTQSHAANWHPLTWLSHMLDCQIFGLNPARHHLVNLAFHIANTLLLFSVLNRMTGLRSNKSIGATTPQAGLRPDKGVGATTPRVGALWRSAVVAGLFALHPLHVESVAWIAERKDVLSTFFWLLTLGAYVRYAEGVTSDQPSPRSGTASRCQVTRKAAVPAPNLSCVTCHPSLFYCLALLFFALGLMSKPMLVTLPFVLLLLDYWPLQRVSRFKVQGSNDEAHAPPPSTFNSQLSTMLRLALEKWPFFLLTAASCVVTFIAQNKGGAVASFGQVPFALRAENALISYFRYIGRMIWPVDLAAIYPFPTALPIWQSIMAGTLLVVLTAWFFRRAGRQPFLLTGWLWYLGTLVPVIGFVQVGAQSMADRYTYVPLIGLFIMIVWMAADWAEGSRGRKMAASILAAAVLSACAVSSAVQLGYWKNSVVLFRHALTVTGNNAVAHNNLATALAVLGRRDEAMDHYSEAARLNPASPLIENNFGVALARDGQTDTAIQHYSRAIQLNSNYFEAYNNLGVALFAQGHWDDAATNFMRALSLNPDYPEARNNFGGLLAREGKHDQAIQQFSLALRLNPASSEAHFNLAVSLLQLGRDTEAVPHLSEAVRLDPASADARYQLGLAFLRQGRLDAAAGQFEEATRLKPDDARAQFNLGTALIELGKIETGIEHLHKAADLRPDWPDALNTLAWVLATQQDDRYRNGAEALRLAQQAAALTGEKRPVILNTLAAAYAETGQFDDAANTARKALALARQSGQAGLVQTIEHALDAYQARQPFRTRALW